MWPFASPLLKEIVNPRGRKMFKRIETFIKDEDGAVTVDWVVLCAGIVALAVGIVTAMSASALGLSDSVAAMLTGWTF